MTRKHKILILATAYQSIVTILDSKIRNLSSLPDFEVLAASSAKESDDAKNPSVPFYSIFIPRTIKPVHDLRAIIRLINIIKIKRIDLLHTHTAKAGIIGAIAGTLCGIPVIHTFHGLPFYPGQKGTAFFIYKFIEIAASRLRACIFSQNKYDFIVLKGIKWIACPVIFEGNGVDVTMVKESALNGHNEIANIFSIDCIKILSIARLEHVKHLEKLIDSVEFCISQGCTIECVIAGKGELLNSLQRDIQQRGLVKKTKIIYTPYIHALINHADIIVLTSEKEGIPRGIMEAMALGKPVLATDVVGTNELVLDGATGILVPYNDQACLNAKLLELINNSELRSRLGNAGHRRIQDFFDERKIVALWSEQYKKYLRN